MKMRKGRLVELYANVKEQIKILFDKVDMELSTHIMM